MSATAASPYHRLLARGGSGAWRPYVGILSLVVLIFGGQFVIVTAMGIGFLVAGSSPSEVTDRLSGDPATPEFLAVVNLGWAVAIPAVLLVVWLVHRMPAGWAVSVVGRMRWSWFVRCLGIAVVALVATVVVSSLLPAQGDAGVEFSGGLNDWNATMRDYLLVIVLLTPLQAAGEEFAFRGYLTQAVGRISGSWGARTSTALAIVLPALLFALAHGLGQDLPIFFDRFAFGLVAGVLVVVTGGLEAGIAMHVLNNFLAFGMALAYGDMSSALSPTDGSWWSIPVTLTQSVIYLGGCWWWAQRSGVTVRVAGGVLEPQRRRV